jgi:hypothetical protein
MKKFFFLFFSFISSTSNAQTFTGQVAVWSGDKYAVRELSLEAEAGDSLSNSKLWINNLPTTVIADKNGCFCFDEKDERFVYVNAFYYGNKQLAFYNRLLKKLGANDLPRLAVDLQKLAGIAPSGSSGNGKVSVTYANFLLDHSILAHEIGHEIHYHLMGTTPQEWRSKYGSRDPAIKLQQSGILEGTANILAALWLKNSRIGFASYFDMASDVDRYVTYPVDDYTVGGVIRRKLSSEPFQINYPRTALDLRNALNDPALKEILIQPDPYWASALINQPIWHAAEEFGRKRIIALILVSLRSFVDFKTYQDFAGKIVNAADKEPEIQRFFDREFLERGIGTKSAYSGDSNMKI